MDQKTTDQKMINQDSRALAKVCFCGRPNVGKSSLFNRLLGRKKALVLDEPGVTRDVYRSKVEWNGRPLELADLAGLELLDSNRAEPKKGDGRRQAEVAQLKKLATQAAIAYLQDADFVLFVVDARAGLTPGDEDLARLVRSKVKPGTEVLIVLSKVEGKVEEQAQLEAVQLGWGEGMPTSAEHNLGIGELKERILIELFGTAAELPAPDRGQADPTEVPVSEDEAARGNAPQPRFERGLTKDRPIRLGVYGRPNVGKSTLVNRLLGEKRMITSPIAGTTVDTIDSEFLVEDKHYRILDTAGIRRKSKTEQGVEVLSVVAALKSVADVDVALFLIDGYEGVTDQDEKIAGQLIDAGKPVILIVNKWDTCRVDRDEYAEKIRKALGFLDFAPILFTSAEQGTGLDSLWDLIEEILRQRFFVAPTGELNRFIELIEGTNNPLNAKLFYATQTTKNPPTITIMVNDPKKVHFAYERFIKNELRQRYGWMGSPLRLIFKSRKRSPGKKTRSNAF